MRDAADETTPMLPIGALAKRTGLTVEGIRFYEKAGILRAPARTAGRHRLYSRADLKRLNFIRRARLLGFTLDEVRGRHVAGVSADRDAIWLRANRPLVAIRPLQRDARVKDR